LRVGSIRVIFHVDENDEILIMVVSHLERPASRDALAVQDS